MGIFSRRPKTPRQAGSGGLWDNTNTPGATGFVSNRGGMVNPLVRPRGERPNPVVLPLPNVEPYLKATNVVDPYRLHSQGDILQPEIPVREPRGDVYGAVYDGPQQPGSSGQPQPIPYNPNAPGVAFAPTQVRQRDNLYDAGDFRTLQRFVYASTPSQQYFNEVAYLPEYSTPLVRIHGVQTTIPEAQRGWYQAYVPDPGMSPNDVVIAPPVHLSRPIHVATVQKVSGFRAPLTKATAPKRTRSGG